MVIRAWHTKQPPVDFTLRPEIKKAPFVWDGRVTRNTGRAALEANLDNAPVVSQAVSIAARDFDGVNQRVWFADHPLLNIQSDTLAISCLFYPEDNSGTQTLVRKAGTTDKFILRMNGTSLEFFTHTSSSVSVTSSGELTSDQLNRWHVAVATYDGTTMRLFLDGELVASTGTQSGNLASDTDELTIGGRSADRYFDGKIAHVVIEERILTYGEASKRSRLQNYWDSIYERPRNVAIVDLPDDTRFAKIKRPWQQPPPANTPLNLNHPLSKGLVAAVPILQDTSSRGFRDYGPQRLGTAADGTLIFGQDEHGTYFDSAASESSELLSCPIPQNAATVAIGLKLNSGSGRLFGSDDAFECQIDSANVTPQLFHGGGSSPSFSSSFSTGVFYPFLISATNGDSSSTRVFEGLIELSGSGTINNTTPSTPATMQIGSSRGLTDGIDARVYYFFMWDRQLSTYESIQFQLNPWQIFEPRLVAVPFDEALPDLTRFEKPW